MLVECRLLARIYTEPSGLFRQIRTSRHFYAEGNWLCRFTLLLQGLAALTRASLYERKQSCQSLRGELIGFGCLSTGKSPDQPEGGRRTIRISQLDHRTESGIVYARPKITIATGENKWLVQ